jgi:hypothetical protein
LRLCVLRQCGTGLRSRPERDRFTWKIIKLICDSSFFYINEYDVSQKQIVLDEDTSKHIVQVLRMKKGEKLNLSDGKEIC